MEFSNSLKNWWWEIFTYPILTFRCGNCIILSESDYFSILKFIQSSGGTWKTLIKVWKMQKNVSMRVATFILFEMSLVYHTQCYDFTHATFLLHAIEQRPLEIKLLKSRKNKIITNNKTTKISNGRRMRIFAGFSSEQSIPIFKSSGKHPESNQKSSVSTFILIRSTTWTNSKLMNFFFQIIM